MSRGTLGTLVIAGMILATAGAYGAGNPYCVGGITWRTGGGMDQLGMPGGVGDWDGSLGYNWGQLDPHSRICMTNPSYRWTEFGRTPPVHAYLVDEKRMVDPAATETWVRAHPGCVYLIGNEPNNGDLAAGDGMTPSGYAQMYDLYYHSIKEWDSTARIAVGGLVATSNAASLEATTNWWNQVLSFYRQVHDGENMPIDIWNNHCYSYVGELDPDRIIDVYFRPFREYVDTVLRGAYRDTEIWCTEYGVGMWSTPLSPEYMAEFIEQLCPRLEDSGTVDRFFWFLGYWSESWGDSALLDPDRVPTVAGEAYARLAAGIPNDVPGPIPDPPPAPGPFSGNFDDGELAPWRVMAGEWSVADGVCRQARINGKWGHRIHLPWQWDDVRVAADVRVDEAPEDRRWVGIRIRASTIWRGGARRGLLAFMRRDGEVGLSVGGEGAVVSVPDAVADPTGFHRLEVSALGPRVVIRVDGQPVLTWDDPGGHSVAGLVCLEAGDCRASFDNVEVAPPVPVADRVDLR